MTRRSIPLRLRWARLRSTIIKTLLFNAGAWRLTGEVIGMLRAFETTILRNTLCMRSREHETDGEFMHRLHKRLSFLKEALGWLDVESQVKAMYLGWHGHVARLAGTSVNAV